MIEQLRARYDAGEDIQLPAGVTIDEAIVSIRRRSQVSSFGPLLVNLLNSQYLGNHILNMAWFIREVRLVDFNFLSNDKRLFIITASALSKAISD